MTPTYTRPRPDLGRRGPRLPAVLTVLALAVTFAVGAQLGLSPDVPHRVARLRISNPNPYQVNVEVRGTAGGGWLDLGSIGREQTKTLEQIADPGAHWLFRFSYGGVDAGRLEVPRSQLVREGWSLSVPTEVAERLSAAGLVPSAS